MTTHPRTHQIRALIGTLDKLLACPRHDTVLMDKLTVSFIVNQREIEGAYRHERIAMEQESARAVRERCTALDIVRPSPVRLS